MGSYTWRHRQPYCDTSDLCDLRVMSPLCSFCRSTCFFISYGSDRQLSVSSSVAILAIFAMMRNNLVAL
jgi:hypothetical protein